MSGGPLNYSTKIPYTRTVAECQQLLAAAGAQAVALMFEDKLPTGLAFTLRTPRGEASFSMPVNVDGVSKMLKSARDTAHLGRAVMDSRDHACRVAWRVIEDWLEAQLALIAAEMATIDQVMLPYLQVSSGRTLYEAYLELDGNAVLEVTS